MRCVDEHIAHLARLGDPSLEGEQDQVLRRVVELEQVEAVQEGRAGRLLQTARSPEQRALLRFALARAVAALLGRNLCREFEMSDARSALDDRLGRSVLHGRPSLLVRDGYGTLALARGLAAWAIGVDEPAEWTAPYDLPWWVMERPLVVEAGRRVGWVAKDLSGPVALLCQDPAFAACVASAASCARSRGSTTCRVRTWDGPLEDPFPALAWLVDHTRDDAIVVFDEDRRWWSDTASGWTPLEGPSRGSLYVVLPAGRRGSSFGAVWPHVLDLDPLRARLLPELDPRNRYAEVAQALGEGSFEHIERVQHWYELNDELYPGTASASLPALVALTGEQSDEGEVSGTGEVPEETLDELIVPDDRRQVFERAVDRAHRGERCVLLLHGPPGTGKTFGARCLAGTLQRPLITFEGAALRGKFWGQEERRLTQLFARAERSGAVLLIDEADDWVGRRQGSSAARGGAHIAEASSMLRHLEAFQGIAVLTTNRSQVLDPALHRRVDAWVAMDRPGFEERMALWSVAVGEKVALSAAELCVLAAIPLSGGAIRAAVAEAELEGPEGVVGLVRAAKRRAEMRRALG